MKTNQDTMTVNLNRIEEAKKERTKHINFWENIPDDCKKAISELQRLKVNNLCAWDHEENFGDVWWLVLHEVDLYAEGEFCKEVSRAGSMADPSAMSLAQAQRADRWLVKWNDLFNKYRTIGEGRFSENEFMYDGQLI